MRRLGVLVGDDEQAGAFRIHRMPPEVNAAMAHGRLMWGGLVVASVLTVLLGLIPGPFLDIVAQAARSIGG